jgi:hypothetical protein
VLLAGSGLLIRSFLKVQSVDKGFVPSSTVTMGVQLDERYNQPERQNAFFRTLIDRAGALPGVEAAAAINHVPLGGGESLSQLNVEGHPLDEKTLFEIRAITPRYFAAMAFLCSAAESSPMTTRPAVRGRHREPELCQAILSRTGCRGESGAVVWPRSPWWTIVGVVGDVRQFSLESTPPMQVYVPCGNPAATPSPWSCAPASRRIAWLRACVPWCGISIRR